MIGIQLRAWIRGENHSAKWGVFPYILACIPFSYVGFSPWDVFSQIRFVGVDGFGATMKELVSIRFGLSIVNVHGLRLYGVQKWQGLIRVLGSFFL